MQIPIPYFVFPAGFLPDLVLLFLIERELPVSVHDSKIIHIFS